jgi:hypothetical protein
MLERSTLETPNSRPTTVTDDPRLMGQHPMYVHLCFVPK